MLHVLNQVLDIFSLIAVPIELITKEFAVLIFINGCSKLIWSFFSWNNELELICMPEYNSVKMLDLLFFSNLEPVHKDFRLWFGNDKELLTFLKD